MALLSGDRRWYPGVASEVGADAEGGERDEG
jgi:hypothetical protein